MLHLCSKGCEYVIRALSEIPVKESRNGFSVKTVCRRAGVPESFTRKAFQTLVRFRLLSAQTGPGGGYRFRKDPKKISILKIIRAVDGKDVFEKCVVKDFKCNPRSHCSLHPLWSKTKNSIIKDLDGSSVAKLMRVS